MNQLPAVIVDIILEYASRFYGLALPEVFALPRHEATRAEYQKAADTLAAADDFDTLQIAAAHVYLDKDRLAVAIGRSGNPDSRKVLEWLIAGESIAGSYQRKAAEHAAYYGNLALLRYFVESEQYGMRSLAASAVRGAHPAILKYAISPAGGRALPDVLAAAIQNDSAAALDFLDEHKYLRSDRAREFLSTVPDLCAKATKWVCTKRAAALTRQDLCDARDAAKQGSPKQKALAQRIQEYDRELASGAD